VSVSPEPNVVAASPQRAASPRHSPISSPRPRPSVPIPGSRVRLSRFLLLSFVGVLIAICVVGFPYYTAPVAERVRSPLHAWLKPAGYVGQSAGLLAIAIFIFLWLYPFRKKARWLAWTGSVGRWLDVHVLAALSLPLLVAIHAAWRFEGLIGLGFWSMMVVWASGVVGRYLYARIPRGKAGIELTIEEIGARRKQLLEQIATSTGLDLQRIEAALDTGRGAGGRSGIVRTLFQLVADDLARRRAARRFRRLYAQSTPRRRKQDRQVFRWVLRLAKREMALTQQARMLDATHALFRWWHVLHRPVAIAALLAVLIHVTVVVALGATWLW
jgi:hypothetical protein